MSENVTISKKRLTSLLITERKYFMLSDGGVDNWSGYDDARKETIEEFGGDYLRVVTEEDIAQEADSAG